MKNQILVVLFVFCVSSISYAQIKVKLENKEVTVNGETVAYIPDDQTGNKTYLLEQTRDSLIFHCVMTKYNDANKYAGIVSYRIAIKDINHKLPSFQLKQSPYVDDSITLFYFEVIPKKNKTFCRQSYISDGTFFQETESQAYLQFNEKSKAEEIMQLIQKKVR